MSISFTEIPPSRMGSRKRMWKWVHDHNKPSSNEELNRVRSLAYKRADRTKSESRYLMAWIKKKIPRVAELDDEHAIQLVNKMELTQLNDSDTYHNECGVIIQGFMRRDGRNLDGLGDEILGPGECIDCKTHETRFRCWYGDHTAGDTKLTVAQRIRKRQQSVSLLKGASAFSSKINAHVKSTNIWKKRAHTRITEVITFPVRSWEIVREAQRIDAVKSYVKVLKKNSKILGGWSNNRLFRLCSGGKVHSLSSAGDILFQRNDSLAKRPAAFLVLTGAIRIQIRFTLKDAEGMARRKDEYYVPNSLAAKTVVQRVADLRSGECLGGACIVNQEGKDFDHEREEEEEEEEEHEHPNKYHEKLEETIELQREEREAFERALHGDPEKAVWTKIYLMMDAQKIKAIQLFHDIDEDGSGLIDPDELREGLRNLAGIELTDDEFDRCMATVDRDGSGEVDYRELSRAIKYGNPQRELSIATQDAKLAMLAKQGKEQDEFSGDSSDMVDDKLQEEKKPMNRIPPCEVVASVANTAVLEIPRYSVAAKLLRSTGMANRLMEGDIAVFNRKALMKKWLYDRKEQRAGLAAIEAVMGPRAKNRREAHRRKIQRTKRPSPQNARSKSVPSLLTLPHLKAQTKATSPTTPHLSSLSPLSAHQTTLLSAVSPFSSKMQKRRFRKAATELATSIHKTQFNPVVLWEDDGSGGLAMKVITKREGDERLNVRRYSVGRV